MSSNYKASYVPTELKEFDQRKTRAQSLIKKFPDRVPIIIRPSKGTHTDIAKFLVPHTMTIANVIQVLRDKVKLSPANSIYISVDKQFILSGSQTVGEVYNSHKDKDEFLYMIYCEESVFGGGTK